jgi:hypothetical protein
VPSAHSNSIAQTSQSQRERPILFSGEMVREILAGCKTQTRRIVKPQPPRDEFGDHCYASLCGPEWYEPTVVGKDGIEREGKPIFGIYSEDGEWGCKCPYEFGMRLWVRESWCELRRGHYHDYGPRDRLVDRYGPPRRNGAAYKADSFPPNGDSERCRIELGYKWTPSIHMPRWACRLELEVTEVRVQRLQEISEEDAKAEGVPQRPIDCRPGWYNREMFQELWDRINGDKHPWESNPWVWAISFRPLPAAPPSPGGHHDQ